jgi:succinate dehydrogenase/fumarate reductase flavoprotein subunit
MRPIVSREPHSFNQRFQWSQDNSREVKKGWINMAPTLSGLAGKLGLPAAQLEETARLFNEACGNGKDVFGRPPDKMERIDAPYYGLPIWPTLLNTQGGPRRNEKAQILDVKGDRIPRLYSAGELGSIWGSLYPGAGNVCEALVYGRIAGRNAAKEKPRR